MAAPRSPFPHRAAEIHEHAPERRLVFSFHALVAEAAAGQPEERMLQTMLQDSDTDQPVWLAARLSLRGARPIGVQIAAMIDEMLGHSRLADREKSRPALEEVLSVNLEALSALQL